jgi:hypothetical protein
MTGNDLPVHEADKWVLTEGPTTWPTRCLCTAAPRLDSTPPDTLHAVRMLISRRSRSPAFTPSEAPCQPFAQTFTPRSGRISDLRP